MAVGIRELIADLAELIQELIWLDTEVTTLDVGLGGVPVYG